MAENFCLKWNDFHNVILNALDELQHSQDLVDVTLMCEGLNVKAHKIVLSACSPYFRKLFKETPCKHPVIILKEVLYSDLEAILRFMYQGEVLVTEENLTSFLKTAELLQVSGLAENAVPANTRILPNSPMPQEHEQEEQQETEQQQQQLLKQQQEQQQQQRRQQQKQEHQRRLQQQRLQQQQQLAKRVKSTPRTAPSTVSSPAAIIPTVSNDLAVVKKQTEKENVEKKPIPQRQQVDTVSEPIQSCSYSSDIVSVKTESCDVEFQDVEYVTAVAQETVENLDTSAEEQSILERSLKAQGVTPHSTKLYSTMDVVSVGPSQNQSDTGKSTCPPPLVLIKSYVDLTVKRKIPTSSDPLSKLLQLPINKKSKGGELGNKSEIEQQQQQQEQQSQEQQQQQQQQQQKGSSEHGSHVAQFGKCPHCPKVYSNLSALKYHVRLIHSDMLNLFCCHLCPEAFEYRDGYKVHMLEMHSVRS